MVAHEAVVVGLDTVAFCVGTHHIFEHIVIFGFKEDCSLLYTLIDDVVIARDFYMGLQGMVAPLFVVDDLEVWHEWDYAIAITRPPCSPCSQWAYIPDR